MGFILTGLTLLYINKLSFRRGPICQLLTLIPEQMDTYSVFSLHPLGTLSSHASFFSVSVFQASRWVFDSSGRGADHRCVFSFILLYVDTQFSKHHLLNTFFSPVSYFDIPVKYQMATVICMHVWALHFVPLDYMPVSVLKPCCFYYCDSVIYPELWNNTSPSFVLFVSNCLKCLVVPYEA